jgi:hypothetical protein
VRLRAVEAREQPSDIRVIDADGEGQTCHVSPLPDN